MSEKKHPGGRPTKYKPEYCELAYNYCLLGCTDAQLSEFLGVSEVTLNAWKTRHPEFLKSLKSAKEDADAMVTKSLYHRANGYSHDEEKIFCGKDGEVTRVKTTKHYPPDSTSMIFWLKNRQPTRFRDKQEVDHGVTDDMAELLKEISGTGAGLPIGGKK